MVGTLVRVVVVAGFVIVTGASASAPKQHTIDKTMRTGATFDQTWGAVIEVFAERNWAIQTMEKDSGLIATDWMSLDEASPFADCGGSGITRVRGRGLRFNVFVREGDDGVGVTVNASFRETRSFGDQVRTVDCVSTGRVESLIHSMVAETLGRQRAHRKAPVVTKPPPPAPDASAQPASGTLGGPCYGNKTCNAGLHCDAILEICQPPPTVTP